MEWTKPPSNGESQDYFDAHAVSSAMSFGAMLLEYVRADDAATIANLAGPDLILQELFNPWQGLVLWGAEDLFALAARQDEGIGCGSMPGVIEATGWWIVATPDSEEN